MSQPYASFCLECGYSLRGLVTGQACPECGHAANYEASRRHTKWSRSVFCGLGLLLAVTALSICSVLVQPFVDRGGTAPSLNLPGPKLWAIPLLLRPLGSTPALPGVLGTFVAMASLLAICLITAPSELPRVKQFNLVRLGARWGCIAVFGMAFGVMMAAQGLNANELPPLRLLLVAGVELPGAILLYVYLRRLAENVPGQSRREAFDRLVMAAPAVVFVGALGLTAQWWWDLEHREFSAYALLMVSGIYSAIALAVGVMAASTIASLASAYFRLAFPWARRWLSGVRYLAQRARVARASLDAHRMQMLANCLGVVLLIAAALMGLDQITWMTARVAPGGILPFVNFPGPKVWSSIIINITDIRYMWGPLLSQTTLLVTNVAAIWLLTYRPGGNDALRRWTRWVPVLSIGAALGAVAGSRAGSVFGINIDGSERTEFYIALTLMFELPATLLLYGMLARLAGEVGRPRLRRQFQLLAITIVGLVGSSVGAFCLFNSGSPHLAPETALLAALFGAATLATAVWATCTVTALAGAAFANHGAVAEVAREIVAQATPLEHERAFDGLDEDELAAVAG
jgi:hypothetical protein